MCRDKGVQCSISCVNCDDGTEDLFHVFFYCSFAIQVWCLAGLWDAVSRAIHSTVSANEVNFALIHNLQAELRQRMAAILLSIWKHCNLKLWQNENVLCVHVVYRARHLMDEWVHST